MAFQVTKRYKGEIRSAVNPLDKYCRLNLPLNTQTKSRDKMTKKTNLEEHLREMQIRSSRSISDDVAAERERLQEEKESILQGLAICANASENLRERLKEEKESTEQCLAVCAKALGYIGQLQSNLSEFSRNISIPGVLISSRRLTANALQECKDILTKVTVDLEEHSKLW